MSAKQPPSPRSSMNLSISQDDAKRMLSASRALNQALRKLQARPASDRIIKGDRKNPLVDESFKKDGTEAKEEERAVKRVVSSSDGSSVGSEEQRVSYTSGPAQLYELVTEAASSCGDPLIESFLFSLRERQCSEHEIQLSLLLFLDMDKSAKLMTAFRVLSNISKTDSKDNSSWDAAKVSPAQKSNLSIAPKASHTLFKFFLTAISSCIQTNTPLSSTTSNRNSGELTAPPQPPSKAQKQIETASPNSRPKHLTDQAPAMKDVVTKKSHSFDSASDMSLITDIAVRQLSKETQDEIERVANFASEQLLVFVAQRHPLSFDGSIAFESFGDWYNTGGYQFVPWLELLDLAKWDVAGKNGQKPSAKRSKPPTLPVAKARMAMTPKLNQPPSKPQMKESPLNFFIHEGKNAQNILVTFDFSAAMSVFKAEGAGPLRINITEDNLVTLKSVVDRTGLSRRSSGDIFTMLQKHSVEVHGEGILDRESIRAIISELVPKDPKFSPQELMFYSNVLSSLFTCFEKVDDHKFTFVKTKEVSIGLSILVAGSKSTKLVAGFDLLLPSDGPNALPEVKLVQYLRSYLTMLIGISLLPSTSDNPAVTLEQQQGMIDAVDSGARWTLSHFLKANNEGSTIYSFEDFASWYTKGGYNVAPWLELLDLKKLFALLGKAGKQNRATTSAYKPGQMSSPRPRRPDVGYAQIPPEEVLFTFPLANEQSLVVLREDATYMRSVVDKLGLLNMSPDELWKLLFKSVKAKSSFTAEPGRRQKYRSGNGKNMEVGQEIFVETVVEIIKKNKKQKGEKRNSQKRGTSVDETISNFFQSFDLGLAGHVAVNQLMGGLSLLCGGKKSTKLAFSFGLFDGRKQTKLNDGASPSLSGEELFLFVRSFLIVMFSCCRQSLDMSADSVVQYISETSQMVAEDVMRYQWHTSKKDRVNFDEFGEWYNEGGFETAPWLELLDLQKWVLVEDLKKIESQRAPVNLSLTPRLGLSPGNPHFCPPPPPDGAFDTAFLDDNTLMPMDSIDEMDFILMQQPSEDKENDGTAKTEIHIAYSPNRRLTPRGQKTSNSLKFHLVTHEREGGYVVSVSQRRVRHLKSLLVDSSLSKYDSEESCHQILNKASEVDNDQIISRQDFDDAIKGIMACKGKSAMSVESQRKLSDILVDLFSIFDRNQTGTPRAVEVACGFTLLCKGKKSDKLEHAFDVMDTDNDGKLTRSEMTKYLESFLAVLLVAATSSHLDIDEVEDSFLVMGGRRMDSSLSSISRVSSAGAEWATSQAFKGTASADGVEQESMSFDDFGDWYTKKGFGSIPWLELLDLRKWVLTTQDDG